MKANTIESMDIGGRQILWRCKRSVNFLPEFPNVLSDNSAD